MKQLIILSFLAFIILPAYPQGIVNFEVRDFKKENDSLKVSYHITISSHAIQTGQSLRISPWVQAGDSVAPLSGVTIVGHNKQKVLSRFNKQELKNAIPVPTKDDAVLNYSMQVPYAAWMDSARLTLAQELIGYRNKSAVIVFHLDEAVDLGTLKPYQVQPLVAFIVPQKEVKLRNRQGKAYLDFQVGRSVILSDYRRNPQELRKIDDVIRDVVNNPDATLQGLYIEGYASPEGGYTLNERLSRNRAQALETYITKKFELNSDLFKVSSVAEDWEGLAQLVKASNLSEKERILEIISSPDNGSTRIAALKCLDEGRLYPLMLRDMFPELRRVEYQIDYLVKDYDITQTLVLLEKNPGDISQLEFYNLALSYGVGSEQFNELLIETIPRHFPEDATANNNAAAVMIKAGELATAKRHLEKIEKNASTLNNIGIIYLLEGNMDQAETYFKQAQALGNNDAVTNLKELQLKREDEKKMERHKNRK